MKSISTLKSAEYHAWQRNSVNTFQTHTWEYSTDKQPSEHLQVYKMSKISDSKSRVWTFVLPTCNNKSKTCKVMPKLTKFLKRVIQTNASTAISRWASTIYVPVAVAPMINANVTNANNT